MTETNNQLPFKPDEPVDPLDEPYAVTYGLYSNLDTPTIKGLVALEIRNLARDLKPGELPGSRRADTAQVLEGFDSVDLVAQNHVNETLRLLRHYRAAEGQPKAGLFTRLAEATKMRAALSVVVAVGAGALVLEGWIHANNNVQQYYKDHPHAIQTP